MPYYAPEEIVYAAGCLPVGMFGAQKPQIAAARTYLPPFACSLMQADMELQLNGTYDCLDAVIFSVPCDTLRCMSQKWHGKAPVIVFTHPQNRKIRPAVDFLKAEYEHVRSELERILGVKISDLAIQEAINVYNENRRTMREFCDLAAQYPQIFTPVKRHDVIKARWFMDKAEHTALVRQLIDAVKKNRYSRGNGKKVVLSGIMPNRMNSSISSANSTSPSSPMTWLRNPVSSARMYVRYRSFGTACPAVAGLRRLPPGTEPGQTAWTDAHRHDQEIQCRRRRRLHDAFLRS